MTIRKSVVRFRFAERVSGPPPWFVISSRFRQSALCLQYVNSFDSKMCDVITLGPFAYVSLRLIRYSRNCVPLTDLQAIINIKPPTVRPGGQSTSNGTMLRSLY
jgi:hypothetical protein